MQRSPRRFPGPRAGPALVLIGTLFLAPARGTAGAAEADERVTVRAHLKLPPASLSMLGKTDLNSEIVAYQVTDSLVQYDPQLEMQPQVARAWEFSEDRRTITFELRDGVRWHDGRPVTAYDVVGSVAQVFDPATESRTYLGPLRDLISIESLGPQRVRARFSTATPDVLEAWLLPLVPRHLVRLDANLLEGTFKDHPVGCGPFRFVRYETDARIVLEANDDYWAGRPQIDRLVFKIYPDQHTALQALLKGDLDIMTVTSELWKQALESKSAPRLEAFHYYRLASWTLMLNQDGTNPFFTDVRVRRALVLALDRDRFREKVVHGQARLGATTYFTDTVWGHPDLEPLPYDPAEAARLLDEAGWTDSDGDGLRDRDGRPFRFTLLIPASSQKLNDKLAAWQQDAWGAVGIGAQIQKLEFQAFRARRNAHRFEALAMNLVFSPNPDQSELYHSDSYPDGFNFVKFRDPEVDRLVRRARETFDPLERRETLFRLQERLLELQPVSSLFHFASPVLHDKRLLGVTPSPRDYYRTTHGPRLWRWAGSEG